MKDAYIVSAVRTVRTDDMATTVIKFSVNHF